MPGTDSDERWRRQFEIFHRALEKEPAERSAFVDGACGDDQELRREVEALLEGNNRGSPLDASVGAAAEALQGEIRTSVGRPAPEPGTLLAGRFEIAGVLGRGGMGTVYEARDRRLGTTVALKLLRDEIAGSEKARARFLREINLARKVTHPNACRVYDLIEDGERVFLTMELLEGETLSQRLERSGRLNLEEAGRIVEQVASALDAAHAVGVVHRDLKPSNVMLVPGSGGVRAVVTDFGLATTQGPPSSLDPNLTRSGQILGTPAYMAPEQLEGGEATAATDVYALGLLTYEMVTGRQAFEGETPFSVAAKRLHGEAPSPRLHVPHLARRWERTILRCLERHPADRFQTAGEVAEALVGDASIVVPSHHRRSLWQRVLGLAAVLLVSVLGLLLWQGLPAGTPSSNPPVASAADDSSPLPFEERDWVLIASFENRTGEAVFDGTLEYALGRELSNSGFVNVVPRERAQDALRLMRKPADTAIDAALGREICLRDGRIRALLTGRVEKLDTTYVLSAALVNPSSGVTVASFSQEAVGQREMVPALRRLSNRVREDLGEKLSLIQESDKKLAKVTTPSLRALQLFSEADAVIARGAANDATAEQLLKQAVTEDPDFASAHLHLAWAIYNQGRPSEEYGAHAERAVELAKAISERERYFISGSYYEMMGQSEKSIAPYQALLRLYPDHYWGINNLANMYHGRGRFEEAAPYQVRRADLRPNDLAVNMSAAHALLGTHNYSQAQHYLERAQKLASLEADKLPPGQVASLSFFPVYVSWLRGEVEQALAEAKQAAQNMKSRSARERDAWASHAGAAYFTLGKLHAAEEMFHRLSEGPWRRQQLELVAWARSDEQTVRAHLRPPPPFSLSATLLVHTGLLSEADKVLSERRGAGAYPSFFAEPFAKIARGELALARGETEEAIRLLQEGVDAHEPLGGWGTSHFFLGSESLARAYEQQGDLERALQVLKEASPARARIFHRTMMPGLFWMRCQWRRAQLYRKLGREQDAREIETELLKLLAYADSDHSLLVQLKRSQESAPARPPK